MAERRIRFRLHTKIIAWSFVPTAIILFVVALTLYVAYQQTTEQLIFGQDEELTQLMANEVSGSFEEYLDRLAGLARLPGIYSGDNDSLQAALADFGNRLVFFDGGVYILNNLGMVVGTQPEQPDLIGQDWSNRSFFRSMIRSPAVFISNVESISPAGENVIVLATPILGAQNEFHGVAAGMFRLKSETNSAFYGTLLKLRIGRDGESYLVDGNRRIIFSNRPVLIGNYFFDQSLGDAPFTGQSGSIGAESSFGNSILTGYAPVPRTNWTLIVKQDWRSLAQPSDESRRSLLLLLVLGLIVPTLVVLVGVQRITEPITDFTAAAQRIADGDFSQEIQVDTGDELEALAWQFNDMAQRLKDLYATLEERVQARTAELQALNSISAVTSQSLDLRQILPDALRKTIEVLGMEAGAVFRLDETSGILHMEAHHGISDRLVRLSRSLPLNVSIIERVVQEKRPLARLVDDLPSSMLRESLYAEGYRLVVSIPLLAQEKVLGAINVVSSLTTTPTEEELAVPEAIGQQIGVAMENARLFNQTVEYAREMELARQAADKANAAKSDFLANVSHELRTPLVSIFGFARIIQRRLEERIFPLLPAEDGKLEHVREQIDRNLEIILAEGQRLMTMINNLLDLEKIEAGKMEWHFRPVSLAQILESAAASTSPLFDGKPISLVKDVQPDLPMVDGDFDRLLQVIINLVSNAVKFTTQGEVRLRCQAVDGEVVVEVIDTGPGIPPEDQGRVFEKFNQIGDPLTSKPKGTGLGLAISKEIVERHNGRIWLSSEVGKGSTFAFALPALGELVDEGKERVEDQDG